MSFASPSSSSSYGWEIVLLVDTQEWQGSKNGRRKIFLDSLKQEIGCCHDDDDSTNTNTTSSSVEVRRLPVGDYMWIARRRHRRRRNNNQVQQQQGSAAVVEEVEEYILDHAPIIERKTLANLAISLQKKPKLYPQLSEMLLQLYRMKCCGLSYKVLLVEKVSGGWVCLRNRYKSGRSRRGSAAYTYPLMAGFLKELTTNSYYPALLDNNNITIEHTNKLEGTVKFLVEQHRKVVKDFTAAATTNSFTTTTTTTTPNGMMSFDTLKSNIRQGFQCPKFLYYLQLLQLKCMGPKRFNAVTTAYPTRESILNAACCCKNQKKEAIKQIVAGINNKLSYDSGSGDSGNNNNYYNKRQRIGPKIASEIYDAIFVVAADAESTTAATTTTARMKSPPHTTDKINVDSSNNNENPHKRKKNTMKSPPVFDGDNDEVICLLDDDDNNDVDTSKNQPRLAMKAAAAAPCRKTITTIATPSSSRIHNGDGGSSGGKVNQKKAPIGSDVITLVDEDSSTDDDNDIDNGTDPITLSTATTAATASAAAAIVSPEKAVMTPSIISRKKRCHVGVDDVNGANAIEKQTTRKRARRCELFPSRSTGAANDVIEIHSD